MPANAKKVVGIDLGGTNMQIGVVDAEGSVIGRSRKKTLADQGRDKILERLCEGVVAACEDAKIQLKELGGLGIGAPGPVNPNGVVLEAVNLRWNNVPLAQMLTQKLSIPVVVDNDVNVAVFGEWKRGAGKGVDDLLGIWLGTGIGGGLILRGQLYEGALFTAGEIGHTVLFPGAAMGNRSLEHNCSRTAVAERITRLVRANEKSSLADEILKGEGPLKSKAIAGAYADGDDLTRRIVDEVAVLVGIAAANAVTLLSLPRVVLGGGLTEAIGKPFVQAVKRAVREYVFPDALRAVDVVASTLEDDAGVVGAAMLARERLA